MPHDNFPQASRKGDSPIRGLSLLQLLVSIVILSVLVALSIPVHSSIRNRSDQVTSLSNLRQCVMLMRNIANDKNGVLTLSKLSTPWIPTMWPHAYPNRSFPAWKNDCSNLRGTFFYDPSVRADLARGHAIARSFALNVELYSGPDAALQIRLNAIERPTATCLLATVGTPSNGSGVSSNLSRHRLNFRLQNYTLANVGFVDGSARSMSREELEVPLATYEDVFWRGR